MIDASLLVVTAVGAGFGSAAGIIITVVASDWLERRRRRARPPG